MRVKSLLLGQYNERHSRACHNAIQHLDTLCIGIITENIFLKGSSDTVFSNGVCEEFNKGAVCTAGGGKL
jgi:hypothetical protein